MKTLQTAPGILHYTLHPASRSLRGRTTYRLVLITDSTGKEHPRWGECRVGGSLKVRWQKEDYLVPPSPPQE
jgi:hypothetical protein